RYRPFGAVSANTARPDHASEAHRKAQHLDACQPRDDVMTELMEHDEHAERDRECADLVERVDHARVEGPIGCVARGPLDLPWIMVARGTAAPPALRAALPPAAHRCDRERRHARAAA